ncbi:MAG: ThuA domain-containing protein, partial [bacterium]|nr:ThuA domain-containing protein [bacterium]
MKHLLHTWYRSFAGLVVLLALIALCGNPAIAAPSLKALIIDGQNNHNWQGTTPVLREILLESGLFQVDTVTTPAQGKLMDSFRPDFSGYDVLVMNYTGDDWPKETQIAFESYVRNGGGLVIFHAANNAFPQWQEFNEMIGVGGWGGRNEKSGPMLYYEDGQLKEDNSPGPGGAHGPQVEYQVVTRNTEHPIMKDLPASWLHVADECYAKLRGPAKNITLLATALSELTNRHEPMLFTIQYHKGRVFHTALGHDAQQLRCVGTAFTLQRGTEWAATGNVTLPVPENFPTENKTSLRPLPVSYKTIIAYEPNQSRKELAALEENIRLATPSQLANIEAELDTILTAPQATFWAKQFACQVLRRIATAQSLPALTQCLNDDK